jgi:hypothetical protein
MDKLMGLTYVPEEAHKFLTQAEAFNSTGIMLRYNPELQFYDVHICFEEDITRYFVMFNNGESTDILYMV